MPPEFEKVSASSLLVSQNLTNLLPRYHERAVYVGRTGSGKTTLAEYILRHYAYVAVLDTKGLLAWRGYHRVTHFDELATSTHHHVLYAPSWEEMSDEDGPPKFYDFFEWVFGRGNTVMYVDEVMAVTRKNVMPTYYQAALTRGREFGVGVHSATQRPKDIPQAILSESEHLYVFNLQLPQDRERVMEVTGEPVPYVRDHAFAYKHIGVNTLFQKYQLALPEKEE